MKSLTCIRVLGIKRCHISFPAQNPMSRLDGLSIILLAGRVDTRDVEALLPARIQINLKMWVHEMLRDDFGGGTTQSFPGRIDDFLKLDVIYLDVHSVTCMLLERE